MEPPEAAWDHVESEYNEKSENLTQRNPGIQILVKAANEIQK